MRKEGSNTAFFLHQINTRDPNILGNNKNAPVHHIRNSWALHYAHQLQNVNGPFDEGARHTYGAFYHWPGTSKQNWNTIASEHMRKNSKFRPLRLTEYFIESIQQQSEKNPHCSVNHQQNKLRIDSERSRNSLCQKVICLPAEFAGRNPWQIYKQKAGEKAHHSSPASDMI